VLVDASKASKHGPANPAYGLAPTEVFFDAGPTSENGTRHFFTPNQITPFSIGTRNKHLQSNPDGSVTIDVQAAAPSNPAHRANWLPAPKDNDFSLYMRICWPTEAVTTGAWTPPAANVD
jgi:hypothetical protein